MGTTREGSYYKDWYAEHKDQISERRKERYKNDPEYRQRALENRQKQLERSRGLSPLSPMYTTTFSEAAEELGVTLWRLRNWRKNNYFPEPFSYGKFLYFTDNQVQLLKKINEFMGDKPRLSKEDKEKMSNIADWVFANWTEND